MTTLVFRRLPGYAADLVARLGRGIRQLLTRRAGLAVAVVALLCGTAAVAVPALSSNDQANVAAPAAPARPTVQTPAPQPPAPATTAAAVQLVSMIRLHSGDTLWALARHHHTTVATLQSLNHLGATTRIYAGKDLAIPTPAAATAAPAASTAVAATDAAPTAHPGTTAATHDAEPGRIAAATAHAASAAVPARGSVQQAAAAVFGSQYGCAASIITRESGWNVHATNPSSGAYGLAQALPGSKMATAGPDWRTDPATQLAWMRDYVTARYGGACGAWAFWQAHHRY